MRWLVSASTLPPVTARLTLVCMQLHCQLQLSLLSASPSGVRESPWGPDLLDVGKSVSRGVGGFTCLGNHPCAHARRAPGSTTPSNEDLEGA
jgi:hypothetical protein